MLETSMKDFLHQKEKQYDRRHCPEIDSVHILKLEDSPKVDTIPSQELGIDEFSGKESQKAHVMTGKLKNRTNTV